MSEPTYRITTECTGGANPWEARAVRLTDGEHTVTGYGDTEGMALRRCVDGLREYAEEDREGAGAVYFADEDGNLMDAPPVSPDSRRAA